MPATYHPSLPGKRTPSAREQPDGAYLRVSGPLGPEWPVLHHGVPVPRALTGGIVTIRAYKLHYLYMRELLFYRVQ